MSGDQPEGSGEQERREEESEKVPVEPDPTPLPEPETFKDRLWALDGALQRTVGGPSGAAAVALAASGVGLVVGYSIDGSGIAILGMAVGAVVGGVCGWKAFGSSTPKVESSK